MTRLSAARWLLTPATRTGTSVYADRVDWVGAVGYQHEVVHSAVVDHLLSGADSGSHVAQALLGDETLHVEAVCATDREARIGPRRRRPIDFAATLKLRNGRELKLGVEVKVDSAWSPEQLKSTVAPGDRGVLLAVGCTALAATEAEMPSGWRFVGPAEWASIVAEHASGDQELEMYVGHVRREDGSHVVALQRVNENLPVEEIRERTALGHWAYFHEVVASRPAGEGESWERKTLISGPLLTLWIDAGGGGRGAYIELMGHSDETRTLCVKCWSHGNDLPDVRATVAALVGHIEGRRLRRSRARDKSCTAWACELGGKSPREAAARCEELVNRLTGSW
jgi:hypothetical protein